MRQMLLALGCAALMLGTTAVPSAAGFAPEHTVASSISTARRPATDPPPPPPPPPPSCPDNWPTCPAD